MSQPQPTATIVDQADVLGWSFERYSSQAGEWVAVVTLTPEATAQTLRQKYGNIQNVTEIIALDPAIDEIARVCDRIDPLGWRFETCSDQTEEWTELIELDPDATEDDLHQQHEPIRDLTPIGRVTAVAQALYDHEETFPRPETAGGDRDAC